MGFNSAPAKLNKVHKGMVSNRRAIAYNKHVNDTLKVRKMYQIDANNFSMIFSHKWSLHVSDTS
jgi:hypothetical protein